MSKEGRYTVMATVDDPKLQQVIGQFNTILARIGRRLDAIDAAPNRVNGTISTLTVDGKQGCFNLVWTRVAGVDGYLIEACTDTAMTTRVGRWEQRGSESNRFTLPVGNVAVTYTWRVWPFIGSIYGGPSQAVTATTAGYGAGEAAPSTPPTAPLAPDKQPPRSIGKALEEANA